MKSYNIIDMYANTNNEVIFNNCLFDTFTDSNKKTSVVNHSMPGYIDGHKAILISNNCNFSLKKGKSYVFETIRSYSPWYCSFWIYRTKDYNKNCRQDILCIGDLIKIQINDDYDVNTKGNMTNSYTNPTYNRVGVKIDCNYYCMISNNPMPCNKWTHVYIDFDGNDTHSLYINGNLESQNLNNPSNYDNYMVDLDTISFGNNTEIGYIDDFKLVTGNVLYTSNYDPNNSIEQNFTTLLYTSKSTLDQSKLAISDATTSQRKFHLFPLDITTDSYKSYYYYFNDIAFETNFFDEKYIQKTDTSKLLKRSNSATGSINVSNISNSTSSQRKFHLFPLDITTDSYKPYYHYSNNITFETNFFDEKYIQKTDTSKLLKRPNSATGSINVANISNSTSSQRKFHLPDLDIIDDKNKLYYHYIDNIKLEESYITPKISDDKKEILKYSSNKNTNIAINNTTSSQRKFHLPDLDIDNAKNKLYHYYFKYIEKDSLEVIEEKMYFSLDDYIPNYRAFIFI